MGANDAAEMLEVAKAECIRLERIIADALVRARSNATPYSRVERMVEVLEKAAGESGRTPLQPLRFIIVAPTRKAAEEEAANLNLNVVAIVTPTRPDAARGIDADRIHHVWGEGTLSAEDRIRLTYEALPSLDTSTRR